MQQLLPFRYHICLNLSIHRRQKVTIIIMETRKGPSTGVLDHRRGMFLLIWLPVVSVLPLTY